MKAFLDTHLDRSRTFVLWGKTNDVICCPDLVIRNYEQYLVKLLKDRGYEHIIFWGASNGAYCLDPDSARFFFSSKAGETEKLTPLALTEKVVNAIFNPKAVITETGKEAAGGTEGTGEGTEETGEETGKGRKSVSSAMDGWKTRKKKNGRGGYAPGDNPVKGSGEGKSGKDPEPGKELGSGKDPEPAAEKKSGEKSEDKDKKKDIRYAYREMDIAAFISNYSPLLRRKDSRMAMVFYNIFVGEVSAFEKVRDDILSVMSRMDNDNLILFLAPEDAIPTAEVEKNTMKGGTAFITGRIQALGLGPKFLRYDAETRMAYLNPDVCFEVGLPGQNEICHYLRRLSIIGTEKNKRRISFSYRDIDKIAARIAHCARTYRSGEGENAEHTSDDLRAIIYRMERWIERQKGAGSVRIDADTVNRIWQMGPVDERTALEKLNRPGWEPIYEAMKELRISMENFRARHPELLAVDREEERFLWVLERFATEKTGEIRRERPKAPSIILTGSPGTGKSTAARLIGEFLYETGYLKKGRTIETSKQRLTSIYQAGIPQETMARVYEAQENVLFIDEAQQLASQSGSVNGNAAYEGKEVVQTLNNAMTNPNLHFSVVLAGYEAGIEEVLKLDEGFERRFSLHIHIPDYRPELLEDILTAKIGELGGSLSPDLVTPDDKGKTPLRYLTERIYNERDRVRFGNAGDMEKLAEKACGHAPGGLVGMDSFLGLNGGNKNAVITEKYFSEPDPEEIFTEVEKEIRERFVGMDVLVERFRGIYLRLKERLAAGLPASDIMEKPIVLVGNPGTGKTSLAEILPKLYFNFHILGTPEPVMALGSEMTRPGGVEHMTELVKEAQQRRALLFVDEAQQMAADRFGIGRQALQACLAPLTDKKHPFLLVLTSYPDTLDELVGTDPGLESRFEFIYIDDYTPEQLLAIFNRMAKKEGVNAGDEDSGMQRYLSAACRMIYDKGRTDINLANARAMENLLKKMNDNRFRRCEREGIPFGTEEYRRLLPDDLPDEYYLALTKEGGEIVYESALERLNRPGWETIYRAMLDLKEKMENQSRRNLEAARGNVRRASRMKIPSIILTGSPGTGKSTAAREIGEVLRDLGYLRKGHTIEANKEKLTSTYQAGIPKAVMTQVDLAEEGVLFIDEAQQLASGGKEKGSGVIHSEYEGREVVQTLNNVLTSPEHHLTVILAGYKKGVEDVLDLDEGFSRRFAIQIEIPDYRPELLESILLANIRERHCTPEESLTLPDKNGKTPIRHMVERIYAERDRVRFGNAGAMVNLAEDACGRTEDGIVTRECFFGSMGGYPGAVISEKYFEPVKADDTFEEIEKEIRDQFVGMDKVIAEFRNIYLRLKENELLERPFAELGEKPIILAGRPGTGKTTLAKLLPRLYFRFGILGTPLPVICDASELIGRYQGESVERMNEKIREAQQKNAMLFVDEAHQLAGSDYGKQAIRACMAKTTDKAHPFLLVFTSYPDKISDIIGTDPGAKRRFKIISLDDYTPEELYAIFCRLAEKKGIALGDEKSPVRSSLRRVCDYKYRAGRGDPGYGNAAEMQDLFDQMDVKRMNRVMRDGIPVASPEYMTFIPEDLPDNLYALFPPEGENEAADRLIRIEQEMEADRVGAEELKEIIRRKIQALRYNLQYPSRARDVEPGHYFFKGNPGTGKTTGAEFLARYFAKLGIIGESGLMKRSASDLIGEYVGHTQGKTDRLLISSLNHVLLIDEAYALKETGNGGFKKDAVAQIVNFLDDEAMRKISCVIFAGYSGDMDSLYGENQGLKSRITEVEFKNFDHETCLAVFRSMAEKENYEVSRAAMEAVSGVLEKLERMPAFSNGRTVRKLYDYILEQVYHRALNSGYEENDVRAGMILPEDIPDPLLAAKALNLDS